jgi:hypothetical protein
MDSKVGQEAILLGTIAQTIPDPIFIIDEEGTYIEVLGGIERNLYDSVDYLKKKRIHDVLPTAIADRFISTIKKAIDSKSLQIIEYELTSIDMNLNPMDGPTSPQWYEGRVFPFRLSSERKPIVMWLSINITENKRAQIERDKVTEELKKALYEIKTLRGILPFCSFCKKIRDDKGYWEQVDVYIHKHSQADISHSICPDCAKKHYPDSELFDD